MKTLSTKAKINGLTLIELLVVICVIAVLAALLLPPLAGGGPSQRTKCLINLRQISLGFILFTEDHEGKFPMQVSALDGGTMEFAYTDHIFPHFEKLPTYLKMNDAEFFKLLVCPSDKSRLAVTNALTLNDSSISYFLNADSSISNTPAQNILAGDRNLTVNRQPVKRGPLLVSTNLNMDWSATEIHKRGGMLSFADGNVSWNKAGTFNTAIQQQPLATNRLCFP